MDEKIEKFNSWYDPHKKYNLKVTKDEFHMKVKKVGIVSRIWTKAQEVVINQIQSDIKELKSDVAILKQDMIEVKRRLDVLENKFDILFKHLGINI